MRVRAALYIDFDNMFSGLAETDVPTAVRFAENAGLWLEALRTTDTVGTARNWLVRRCYMNPAGWVLGASGERIYFSRFRPYFTRAGFDVVDCPSLTSARKNAADIRIVVDVMDALVGPAHYDEFVIASGDADFAPLLVRLRAADRRTTVITTTYAAQAYRALADRLLDQNDVVLLFEASEVPGPVAGMTNSEATSADAPLALDDGLPLASSSPHETSGPDESTSAPTSSGAAIGDFGRFRDAVLGRLNAATGPLLLAQLGIALRDQFGEEATTGWFGHRTLSRAAKALGEPAVVTAGYYIWLDGRHQPPPAAAPEVPVPPPVAKLVAVADLPRLRDDVWPAVFEALAAYGEHALVHEFSLTQATAWPRDRLAAEGVDVARGVFGFVVRGASSRGRIRFGVVPAPSADQIAVAFARSIAVRAQSLGLDLDAGEWDQVISWLGLGVDAADDVLTDDDPATT